MIRTDRRDPDVIPGGLFDDCEKRGASIMKKDWESEGCDGWLERREQPQRSLEYKIVRPVS